MNWPPRLSWTSISPINGMHSFVAINYGIDKDIRWVRMVSVLDGGIRFTIDFDELENPSNWLPGWIESENIDSSILSQQSQKIVQKKSSCLHPSEDSGLTIPLYKGNSRSW